jgi:hypothetical protein
MTIELEGSVVLGDEYRVSDTGKLGAVHIGDVDVVRAADHYFDNGDDAHLRILPKGEKFEGPVKIDLGYGDRDWRPVRADSFYIGGEDVLASLDTCMGQDIIVQMWKEE